MLKGTGISDGIGLGKAIIFKSQKIKLEKNKIKDVTLEKEKLYKAISDVDNSFATKIVFEGNLDKFISSFPIIFAMIFFFISSISLLLSEI